MKTLKKRSLTDSWSGSRMRILTARVLTAVLTVSLLMGVSACSSEDADDLLQRSEVKAASTALTLEQALERATPDLNMLDPETRSNGRVVESSKTIHLKGVSNTRSGEKEDLDVYVVNFADNGGYAILGSDTRMSAVYGMSPEGSLDLEGSVGSPIDFYLSDILPKIVDYELSTADGISLPGGGSGGPIIGVDTILPNPLPDNPAIPLIKKYPAENWIPGKPFYPTVLIAQLSSYYKYPKSYDNRTINWDMAISGNQSAESDMFNIISSASKKVEINGNRPSGVYGLERYICGTLTELGYPKAIGKSFSTDLIISQIDKQRPVIVLGEKDATSSGTEWDEDGGKIPNGFHKMYDFAWIIDAYKYTGKPHYVGTKIYYHFIWGHINKNGKKIHTNGFFNFLVNRSNEVHDNESPDVENAMLDDGASWGDYSGGLENPNAMLFTNLRLIQVQDPYKNK